MKTFAKKQSSNDTLSRRRSGAKQTPVPKISAITPFPTDFTFLRRKPICPCDGGCPRCAPVIQPKLIIGQPDDKYEQEADRVADEVMRMPELEVQPKPTWPLSQGPSCGDEDMEGELIQTRPIAEEITPLVQRQPEEEEEEPIKELEEEEEPIMTKALSNGTLQVTDSLRARLNRSKGGGQQLPETDRNFMETRFGVDFSGVRVHTDSNALQMNRELNAQAFTYGRDIYFSAEKYNPGTSSSKRLLAHELTHVVQQRGKASKKDIIWRKVIVEPSSAAGEILGYFNYMCPDESFGVSGNTITEECTFGTTEHPNSCECLCETVNDTGWTYTIYVITETNKPRNYPMYNCSNLRVWVPWPLVGPHSSPDYKHVYIPARTGNEIEFGAFDPSSNPLYYPNYFPKWRILAHELCGHCRPRLGYTGTKGDRPGHDKTIEIENKIASDDHGHPKRGLYNDRPRQGESLHYKVGDSDESSVCHLQDNLTRVVFKLIDGWHYEKPLPYPPDPYLECILDRFAINSAILTEQHRKDLPEISMRFHPLFRSHTGSIVSAVGHTDAPGSLKHNEQLGKKRAKSMRAGLGYYCVPWNTIIMDSKGERELLVPTEDYEPHNRRVETEFKP